MPGHWGKKNQRKGKGKQWTGYLSELIASSSRLASRPLPQYV